MTPRLLSVAALFFIAACGATDATPEHAAVYEPKGAGGDQAMLNGSLVLEGDCFYVKSAEGQRYTPVFPRGSIQQAGEMLTYKGKRYEPGDDIALTGGENPKSSRDDYIIPAGCDDSPLWIVNQDG